MRKLFGIILFILGVLFILAFVGQISNFIEAIRGLSKLFTGELDASQLGQIVGFLGYWILHFAIIYFSFKYGAKLIKKKPL